MGAVDHGHVVAAGVRHVNLVRDRIHGNGHGIPCFRVRQRLRGVRRAINYGDAVAAGVRYLNEIHLRIHAHSRRGGPNHDRRGNGAGRAVNYGEVVAL